MLPANPHGFCGFTVEVGSMAPLVKVGEGLKVGVASVGAWVGMFLYFPLDFSCKPHTTWLLTAFKKKDTVPINLENNEPFFHLLLITSTNITT